MEASIVESVRAETAKALKGAQEVNQRPYYGQMCLLVYGMTLMIVLNVSGIVLS